MKILRLRFLLKKIFGKNYEKIRGSGLKFFRPFILKLNKKIDQQSIVNKERGFIIDGTLDNYCSIHLRPKKSNNFHLASTEILDKRIGILIQGNIGKNYDYLKETLKIYEKIFPNILIIISTWKSENQKKILNLKNNNIKILFNDEPSNSSPGNTDYQLISTYNGLNLAKEEGLEYCLKQRTDFRINKNNAFSYLISLIENFPIKKKNSKTKGRIISTSFNTLKYRLFSLSDFVFFGYTEDLLIYFENKSYRESLKKYKFGNIPCFIEDTPVVAEIFFCARYLKNLENDITWSLDFWWNSLKNYFCVIDASSLDLFWPKYEREFEYRYCKNYSNKISRGMEFSDWLSLYNDKDLEWKKHFSEHERYNESFIIKNYKY